MRDRSIAYDRYSEGLEGRIKEDEFTGKEGNVMGRNGLADPRK
jgi:hypothetical protein